MTGIGRLAVTLGAGSDKFGLRIHHSSRTPVRLEVPTRRVWRYRLPKRAHEHLRGAIRNFLLWRVFRADRGRGPGRVASRRPVLCRRRADLIDATVRRYRTTESRVGASLVHLGHAARLWSPVLACALGHGVVPDLSGLQRADDGAALRLPEPAGVPVTPTPELLYRLVVQHHMEPLAAGLRVNLAPGLLSGNIASALVGTSRALLAERPDLRGPIVRMTNDLLETGCLAGSGVITSGDLDFRRRSCCLFYRLSGGDTCGDCPL